MDFKAIKMRVQEFLTLFDEGSEEVVIMNERDVILYSGSVGAFMNDTESKFYKAIKESFIQKISGKKYDEIMIWIYEDIQTQLFWQDFPRKPMLLVDLLHFFDHKEEVKILDDYNNLLYEGRVEYLMYTGEGELDKVCYQYVSWFEAGKLSNGLSGNLIYTSNEELSED